MSYAVRKREGGRGDVYLAGQVLRLRQVRKLSDAALAYFASLVGDESETPEHRVAAGKVLVAHYEWARTRADRRSPEVAFVRMFGSPDKAAVWLASNLDRVLAMLPDGQQTEAVNRLASWMPAKEAPSPEMVAALLAADPVVLAMAREIIERERTSTG